MIFCLSEGGIKLSLNKRIEKNYFIIFTNIQSCNQAIKPCRIFYFSYNSAKNCHKNAILVQLNNRMGLYKTTFYLVGGTIKIINIVLSLGLKNINYSHDESDSLIHEYKNVTNLSKYYFRLK